MSTQAPLYGLLLVGGKSSRMGTDKAQLSYHDQQPEWQRLHKLLAETCDVALLCHRGDQDFGVPAIVDPGQGPLQAIQAAQEAYPEVAWLVLACDLPLLQLETLQTLITSRDTSRLATCYASSIDQLPEPLCCIYEPSSASLVKDALQKQQYCPRSLLKEAKSITLENPNSLLNANTKADSVEINHILNGTQVRKSLTLQYFAQLKDITGCSEEQVDTLYSTASGLYEELRSRYAFPYKQKQLMLAINDDFCPWEQELKEGDNIVFIPPVAGG